jgi:hypothetical protein
VSCLQHKHDFYYDTAKEKVGCLLGSMSIPGIIRMLTLALSYVSTSDARFRLFMINALTIVIV